MNNSERFRFWVRGAKMNGDPYTESILAAPHNLRYEHGEWAWDFRGSLEIKNVASLKECYLAGADGVRIAPVKLDSYGPLYGYKHTIDILVHVSAPLDRT